MAEIRSTMDMVMERAARIAARAEDDNTSELTEKEGMRLAAEFLSKKSFDLDEKIREYSGEQQQAVRAGISKTLLRNIVLPRDETPSESSVLSLSTVQQLAGANPQAAQACAELKQILDQYTQHKEQVQKQVEEALVNQLQQQAMMQGQETDSTLNPQMHPKYQEEMAKVLSDLNDQYNQALEERKELLARQLQS